MPNPTLTQTIGEFIIASALHYGPGPHPDGSAQQVHAGGQMAFDFDAPEPAADAGQDWAHDKIAFTYGPDDAQIKRLTALLHERLPQATWADVRAAYEFDDRGPDGSGLYSTVYAISATEPGGELTVQGQIFDTAKRKVGYFTRVIHEDVIEHAELMLDGAAQKKGFGSRFYQNSERAYRRMGALGVMTYANSIVGGYAWARAGFDWAFPEDDGQELIAKATAAWRARSRGQRPRPEMPQIAHAWELAALTYPDGTRIGKDILLGSGWQAMKDLTGDNPGLRAGDAYYAQKAQKGKAK